MCRLHSMVTITALETVHTGATCNHFSLRHFQISQIYPILPFVCLMAAEPSVGRPYTWLSAICLTWPNRHKNICRFIIYLFIFSGLGLPKHQLGTQTSAIHSFIHQFNLHKPLASFWDSRKMLQVYVILMMASQRLIIIKHPGYFKTHLRAAWTLCPLLNRRSPEWNISGFSSARLPIIVDIWPDLRPPFIPSPWLTVRASVQLLLRSVGVHHPQRTLLDLRPFKRRLWTCIYVIMMYVRTCHLIMKYRPWWSLLKVPVNHGHPYWYTPPHTLGQMKWWKHQSSYE